MEDKKQDTEAQATVAKGKAQKRRILRYDEIFDIRSSQVQLLPSIKPNLKTKKKEKAVIVVRRIIDQKGLHVNTEVDLKSKAVIEAMQQINANVEGISLRTNPPVIPLELFYHNRQDLKEQYEKARETEGVDERTVADLKTLADFAIEEHADVSASIEPLSAAGEITWDLLWTLFPPGILVARFHDMVEQDQVLLFQKMSMVAKQGCTRYWSFTCVIVADNGKKFGRANEKYLMEIDEFVGARKIADLRIVPLEHYPRANEIRQAAKLRGQRVATFDKPRVTNISGPAMFEDGENPWEMYPIKFTTHGRAIVDPTGFRTFNPHFHINPEVFKTLERDSLTEEEHIITTPVVFGFNFGTKKWGGLAADRLSDFEWNEDAFWKLVMETNVKKMVYSMAKQHSSHDNSSFDDFISGKGRGLIGLFSGPPGSGKTLTAEAMAEITKRPLYSVSAGELGVEPTEVDTKLTNTLELAHRWSAVLLIDEADVFLQRRDQNDVKRNALVSIFLRRLEYFQGVLIMTTNRLADCDEALLSRVHMPIKFKDLDEHGRRQVWATFIEAASRGGKVNVSDEELTRLAELKLNGRRIKNMVGSADSLARGAGESLEMRHIELVISVLHGGEEDQLESSDAPTKTNGFEVNGFKANGA